MKTSTMLILAGAGIAVFLIARSTSSTKLPTGTKGSSSSGFGAGLGSFFGGLIASGGEGLQSLFGGGAGQPTSGAPSVGYEQGESFDDFYEGMFGPGATDVAGDAY